MTSAYRSRSMPELRSRVDQQGMGIAFMRGGSRKVPSIGKWDMRSINTSVPSTAGTPRTPRSLPSASRSRTPRSKGTPHGSASRRSKSAVTKPTFGRAPGGLKPLSPTPFPYTIGKRREREERERSIRENTTPVSRFRSYSSKNPSTNRNSYWNVVLPHQRGSNCDDADIPPPPPTSLPPPLTPPFLSRKEMAYSVSSPGQLTSFDAVKQCISKLNKQNDITCDDLGSKALTFTLSSQSGIISSKLLDPEVVNNPQLLLPMLKCAKLMLINVADHIDTLMTSEEC
eukprot:TRINITY_DN91_c0_g2_i1.p1 TRINITY_DN91_c0_g2~~TRINITY_DN91_c0_g2_i1.p1  ORF type:complete len:304 (+),score=46.26 TRINITY_DN91_c0_g2_i1:60-914(+)